MFARCLMALAAPVLVSGATARASTCAEHVVVYRDGRVAGTICVEDTAAAQLTILDLSPSWTPVALAPGPSVDEPGYRATYLALAAERLDSAGPDGDIARGDRFLELYASGSTPRVPCAHRSSSRPSAASQRTWTRSPRRADTSANGWRRCGPPSNASPRSIRECAAMAPRSHGCHRLLPAQALRLAGFVLQHRSHVRHGPEPTSCARVVRHRGRFRWS
jgi:hypothetical protein